MICLVVSVRAHRSPEASQAISMPAQEIPVGGPFALGRGRLLHEGRVLLEEGWGYSTGVGGSCSTYNLRPVVPHPRGVFRPGAAGLAPSSSHRREVVREPETAGQESDGERRGRPLGRGRPARQPGPRQTSRSRARRQLSVHSADISGPAVEAPSGNRWDSKAPSRLATSVRRSCQRHGH